MFPLPLDACSFVNGVRRFTDKTIQRKHREYSDPNSSTNMRKMQDDLQDVQSIMRKNINDILDRGGKLDGA